MTVIDIKSGKAVSDTTSVEVDRKVHTVQQIDKCTFLVDDVPIEVHPALVAIMEGLATSVVYYEACINQFFSAVHRPAPVNDEVIH